MSRPGLGIALAAVGGVIFGASATLGGFAVESVDPLRLAAARVGIAGVCLAPFAIIIIIILYTISIILNLAYPFPCIFSVPGL